MGHVRMVITGIDEDETSEFVKAMKEYVGGDFSWHLEPDEEELPLPSALAIQKLSNDVLDLQGLLTDWGLDEEPNDAALGLNTIHDEYKAMSDRFDGFESDLSDNGRTVRCLLQLINEFAGRAGRLTSV